MGTSSDVVVGDSLRLAELPGEGVPLVDEAGSFGGFAQPTGIAVDDQDVVYILDGPRGVIRRFDPCRTVFEDIPCSEGRGAGPRQLDDPHGLAFSSAGSLFVADTNNQRIQIFALPRFELRASWRRAWRPWDIAVDGRRRAWVTDRDADLVYLLSPGGDVLATVPLGSPTHVAVDTSCLAYVVESDLARIVVLDPDEPNTIVRTIDAPSELALAFDPVAVAVDEDGNVYLSERVTRRVFVVGADDPQDRPRPSPAFDGLGTALAFDSAGHPLIGDGGRQRVVQLRAHGAYAARGQYISTSLDGGKDGVKWHRVRIRAEVPSGTRIVVRTHTSHLERPPEELDRWATPAHDARWSRPICHTGSKHATWDALVLSPPGRHLVLRLELEGDGTHTPRIDRIVVEAPRVGPAQYLPSVYTADPETDFAERFLLTLDAVRADVATRMNGMDTFFSAYGVPPSFLHWLAGWLGLAMSAEWPEERRRALLSQAWRLYARRGTRDGIIEHVRLYTGRRVSIVEHHRLNRWAVVDDACLGDRRLWGRSLSGRTVIGENATVGQIGVAGRGDASADVFASRAHRFTVVVPSNLEADASTEGAVQSAVALAAPAHTDWEVVMAGPRMRVGHQSRVGVDTIVAAPPAAMELERGRLGRTTVAASPGPRGLRVGRSTTAGTTRIG
ncbi:MAG: phage tail protein [Deltaproteobacteria bacterium]